MTHSAAAKIITLYEQHAEAWKRLRTTDLFERPWLDRFLNLVPTNARLLDIGCGNGTPIAEYFIRQGFGVLGIDSSGSMIDSCLKTFPHQQWRVADMRALALDETFGGLIAWDSFFHLTRNDQRQMFNVFRNHAGSKAALMFTSGTSDGEAIGTFEGEPLYHSSLAPAEYRQLLHENGFRVVKMVFEDSECGGRTVWLAQSTI
ncbi:class I SAM-dependent DNA methyltransferase [Serratia plymuthica]|nr:class I SAM-dependent methyltransferase [Serratia plymuthica]QPS20823.1 class I SAM-dependent methyltransferase [Serratia plymuthica]QPS53702.1 class I SAM-dependent methyltransferase [Serratia plymuthica]QPS62437.1 class I SAM-dependent methyltransferase [Serratia plymuthica]